MNLLRQIYAALALTLAGAVIGCAPTPPPSASATSPPPPNSSPGQAPHPSGPTITIGPEEPERTVGKAKVYYDDGSDRTKAKVNLTVIGEGEDMLKTDVLS